MGSEKISATKWTCNADCNATEITEENKLPSGWTDTYKAKYDDEIRGLTLCPECSKNPEDAKRRYEESVARNTEKFYPHGGGFVK